ncbi:MAG: amino acid permease [Candidatus Bathyarchaeia archaeon]
MSKVKLQSQLTLFDVTNLVVGAIIGADIYVASQFGARYLGPFSLVVWVIAGAMAIVIALCFAQCASLLPKVGGPYAYAKEAWGPFLGFIVGWSLWLAEWVSLAVFPVAFVQYLTFFLPNMGIILQIIIKGLFVLFLIASNIFGVRAAGRMNDVLTIVKLAPLILFAAIGLLFVIVHPAIAASNFSPLLPNGLGSFGLALVLIFWAYAGFEISTIPAEEIKDAKKTIPRAIVLGIAIVTVFYLVTNVLLFAVRPAAQLMNDNAPMVAATQTALSWNHPLLLVGVAIVGIGALISVAGSDESGMIGTSRLGYALAADGLFPSVFAKIHPKFKTPYLGIIIQAVTALIAAVYGSLAILIATSVFLLGVAYLATALSVFWLRKKCPGTQSRWEATPVIPILGIIFSVVLIVLCGIGQILTGIVMLAVGIPIYIKYSPKKELTDLKNALISREAILERAYRQENTFLAHALRHVKRAYRRITGKKETWQANDKD